MTARRSGVGAVIRIFIGVLRRTATLAQAGGMSSRTGRRGNGKSSHRRVRRERRDESWRNDHGESFAKAAKIAKSRSVDTSSKSAQWTLARRPLASRLVTTFYRVRRLRLRPESAGTPACTAGVGLAGTRRGESTADCPRCFHRAACPPTHRERGASRRRPYAELDASRARFAAYPVLRAHRVIVSIAKAAGQ